MAVYVMTGGSNANVVFHTDATCDTNHTSGLSDGSTTSIRHITHDANDKIKLNQFVSGTGIPINAYVAAINNSTCFTLSADPTATNTNTTLSFSSVNTTLGNSAHNVNFDTPTNPIIHNTDTDVDEYISAEIRTDNSTGTEMVKQSITINCNTTSGDATVTHDGLNTITTGTAVSGTGISGGTTVSSIISPTVFELSALATATNTDVSLTFDGYNMYHNNLEATAGYRVKCYDNNNGEGTRLNSINLTTHDYFILLHADDNTQHHFAKITALKTDDVSGDALEFTPKLGNELPKGTKFSVFRGPSVSDTSVVAITAGLLVDSNTVHNYSLVCARPLFYFYNDRLNKKNELDHNIKYKLCYNKEKDTTAITLTDTTSVFITQPDYGLQIVDKSKYGLHVEIIDNRRKADDPRLSSIVYTDANSGNVNTFTHYDTCFHNARREAGDDTEATNVDRDRTGPYTYLHYEDSPMKINNPISLFSSKSYDSIGNRSAFSESKFVDTNRILSSKFQEGDNYAIRSKLKEGRISQWFELPITISTISNHVTTFNIPNNYDLRLLFGYNEEIKMGNYIGTISNIAAPNYTTMTQQITLNSHYRLDTASTFSSLSANPASVDDVGYRRTWSPATRTFMIDFTLQTEVSYTFSSGLNDHPISTDDFTYKMNNVTLASYAESRLYNSYLVFGDTNYELLESRVLFDDRIHSYLRLEPPRNHYRTVSDIRTSYDYLFGVFALELEIFTGTIEEIKNYLESSAPIFEVSGRDNFSKLISPIINKNTLYTQDMVYSSKSPLQKMTKVTSASGDVTFDNDVAINDTGGDVASGYKPTNLSAGDYLFNANGLYIGEVSSASSSSVTIGIATKALINVSSSDVLYKQNGKPYAFTKALQSSYKNSKSFSSLTGASNRGLFFTSGVSLDSSGDKSATLTGTSSNTNINAVGNHLNSIEKVNRGGGFQALLKDEYGSTTFTSDVVNTLSDFVVLSINKEEEETTIELAPRVPLFLGRVDDYDYYDSDLVSTVDTAMNVSATTTGAYINTTSTTVNDEFKRNDPVYLSTSGVITFAGYFIKAVPNKSSSTATVHILLDREVSATSGADIHKIDNNIATGMYFLNRPTNHLLQLAGQVSGTSGLQPFNYETTQQVSGTNSTYVNDYHNSIYRLIDMEEGQYDTFDEHPKSPPTSAGSEENAEVYYNTPSKTNFFALAHRFNAGYITSPITTDSRKDPYTTTGRMEGLVERRGNKPSRGTNFSDFYFTEHTTNKFPNILYAPTITSTADDGWLKRVWERTLRQMDAKVSRNFLFVSSDLFPYTSKRDDSLFKSGRNLTDFTIMLRTKGVTSNISQNHTKYLGGGNSIDNTDKNTVVAGISSAPDISSLKRFSMLRLVEMTLDWHFNSVDVENLPAKNKVLSCFRYNYMGNSKEIIDSGGNALTISGQNTTNNTITLTGTPDNLSFFSDASFNTNGNTTINSGSHARVRKGMYISGGDIPADTFIVSTTPSAPTDSSPVTSFVISNAATGSSTGHTITFYHMYDLFSESGFYIGRSSTFSGSTVNFGTDKYSTKGPYINEGFTLAGMTDLGSGTGTKVYAVLVGGSHLATSDYTHHPTQNEFQAEELTLGGHGGQDTFVKMPTTASSFSMLQGAVINTGIMNNSSFGGYAEEDDDQYHQKYLPNNSTRSSTEGREFSLSDLFHDGNGDGDRDYRAQIALPPTFQTPVVRTKYPILHTSISGGNTTFVKHGTGSTTIAQSIIDKKIYLWHGGAQKTIASGLLINGNQYDIFIGDGSYLGRTAASQTYNQNYLSMESIFLKRVMDEYSGAGNAQLFYALAPNQSLTTTHGNTHKSEVIRTLAKNKNRFLFNETLPVFLDRSDIEDGGQVKVSEGLVSHEIGFTVQVDGNMNGKTNNQPHKVMLSTDNANWGGFGEFRSPELQTVFNSSRTKDGNSPFVADGAYMLFKPFLRFYDNDGNDLRLSTADVKQYTSTAKEIIMEVDNLHTGTRADKDYNLWLNFAPNLTGCYLVSNSGNPYGNQGTNEQSYYPFTNSSTNTYASPVSFANKIPDNIMYIISHTMKRTGDATKHVFIVDNFPSSPAANQIYRVMRVAENTFYDFSPKTIKPYVPSSEYTKKAYKEEMYSDLKDYRYATGRGGKTISEDRSGGSSLTSYANTGHNEAICSMYVIADPDRQGSGNFLTYRQVSDVFGSLLVDGDTLSAALDDTRKTIKTSIEIKYDATNRINEMRFSNIGELIGAVSVGEIFSITTIENIKGDYTDAHIGSSVNISYESDTLLNDLFESEGLTFTEQDNTQYPLFISPEFKGTDLMAAANFILERKNKALVYNNGFYLRDNESRLFKPNIFITETDENYDIKSVSIGKNLFSLRNEIIVYGRNLKSVRKNLRSIKKYGKKSLTLRDENLYTQYDVDRRASRLLRLHSRPSNRVILEVKGNDVFLVKGGDVISLEITSQNIPRRNYLVIEKEYSLDGFTKLVLGEASKNMEDRFSELLVENKKIGASLRPKTFKEPSVSTDIFDSFKIKEIRIKARKRATGGGSFTLGFSTALNIGDIPMGFDSGASIVYTDLFEEELT